MQTVHVGLLDDVDSSKFVLTRVIEYLILHFVYIIQNIAVSSNMNMALLTTRDQNGGAFLWATLYCIIVHHTLAKIKIVYVYLTLLVK